MPDFSGARSGLAPPTGGAAALRGRPPSFPTPTWLSRRCIHRWHGCGRAVHRARRLRASCRRTSRKCPLGMFPKGRLHRCLCGYHTLRGHTGRLQEKATGCSGLGGPFPVGTQYCGGWGLSLPHPGLSNQSWVKLRIIRISQRTRGSLGELTVPPLPARRRIYWFPVCPLCICV